VTTRIIVPHRGLESAKTRLSPVLDPDERAALAEALLRHVLEVATEVAEVVVISPDGDLESLVAMAGARLSVQRGLGLNRGLDQARAEALAEGVDRLAVLHGDLPTLTGPDISALLDGVVGERPMVAIAPDAAETGTNGLALSPPDVVAFQFGPGSFEAHRRAGKRAEAWITVVRRPGLSFDIDTPADLSAWLTAVGAA
jgi:2-phospho-L-lactate guanylyltransferase